MARKTKQGGGEEKDDQIVFENLDGSPDDEEYTDLTPPDDEPEEWSPPDEVESRNSSMVDEGEPDDDGADDDEPEAEELETAEEAEQAARGDDEVDDDLKDLPAEAQQKVMVERRKAREAAQQVQEHQKTAHNAEIERAKSQETAANNELEKQRQAYRDAVEEGDTDKQLQASEAIADLKYKLNQWSDYRGRLEQQGPPKGQQQSQQPQGTTEEANRWLARNKWFQDPSYQEQAQFARTVDKNLVAEGWDPSSREYFDELERRMTRKYPDLPIQKTGSGNGASQQTKRKPKRSPVAAPDKGQATPRQSRGNKVVLNQEDRQNMRRFGLDPNDKDHALMYAREKRKNERAGAGSS